jgi:hypothetical protein
MAPTRAYRNTLPRLYLPDLRNPENLIMSGQKCTKCGLVSWADDTTCKRCGESLLEQSQTSMSPDERSKSWRVPDVVSCSLLGVGASLAAFNRYLGPFGYPISMLAFIIGLGYSIVHVHLSTRHPQLDRKRDAIVHSL